MGIIFFPPSVTQKEFSYVAVDELFSSNEVDIILDLASKVKKQSGTVFNENTIDVDNTSRSSDVMFLPYSDETIWIFDKIILTFKEVNNKHFNFDIFGVFDTLQISEYDAEKQGQMKWHVDQNHMQESSVKLTITVQLSDEDEYEGGDLEIMNYDRRRIYASKKKGSASIFTSYTIHRVTPVTKGIRRSLAISAVGPSFR